MLLHVTRLNRAGMGTQQDILLYVALRILQIEGVMHRTGWVIVRRIERREVEIIRFNFGAFGHRKPHRGKQLLNTLQTARHRMQAAAIYTTAG